MIPWLILADSQAKAMTLAGVARGCFDTVAWRSMHTAGVRMDFAKPEQLSINTKTLKPNLVLRHKVHLNKILAAVGESDGVCLATNDTRDGEALAHCVAEQIFDQSPAKIVHRLRLTELTAGSFKEAVGKKEKTSVQKVEAQVTGKTLDRIITHHLSPSIGVPLGRAMFPVLGLIAKGHHDFKEPDQAPLSTWRLLYHATRNLGFKGIEAMVQARQLYETGFITCPDHAGEWINLFFLENVLEKIRKLVGPDLCGDPICNHGPKAECIRPTNINVEPAAVPKPVRQLYRMIWTAAMMQGSNREVWPRISMGIFSKVHETSGLTEPELILALHEQAPRLNAAFVIKALENNRYIEFNGQEVVLTDFGGLALRKAEQYLPELLDFSFFLQSEYRLDRVEAGEFSGQDVLSEYMEWADERKEQIDRDLGSTL